MSPDESSEGSQWVTVSCCVMLCHVVSADESGEGSQWVKRSSLVDSRTSVTDVKFASKHQGLQLVGGATWHSAPFPTS